MHVRESGSITLTQFLRHVTERVSLPYISRYTTLLKLNNSLRFAQAECKRKLGRALGEDGVEGKDSLLFDTRAHQSL